ncbi:OmpA family protein [Moraxella atlantae]|uniref:Inner membrane lipoprotein YiaD n=1 Tax=Faucicola atlantae TaxID=34059 RepID=A0A378Q6C0_9GAMM|nr:OmpA family protein [Moraxella atlantae]OPH37585.1 hypothetical protein B5J92_00560 [Moraxella atlantae]STY96076.1 Inner membrane lipoprotein YiaD precursor [Moraxella atlantae]
MRKQLLTAGLASAILVTGCATDPNTGQQSMNKTATGGLLGAAAGAAISKATGGDKTGRDAAIGAVLGSGIGYYMEQQEAKLRQQTAGTGITVTRDPNTNNINMVMPEAITFNKAQSNIMPQFYNTLDKVAGTLAEYNRTTVTVKGHASAEGNPSFNQQLSQNRANAVAQYLAQRGVASNRIQAVGYGISQPIADNSTEAGRMQNRRVEITINAPQN